MSLKWITHLIQRKNRSRHVPIPNDDDIHKPHLTSTPIRLLTSDDALTDLLNDIKQRAPKEPLGDAILETSSIIDQLAKWRVLANLLRASIQLAYSLLNTKISDTKLCEMMNDITAAKDFDPKSISGQKTLQFFRDLKWANPLAFLNSSSDDSNPIRP